MTERRNSQPIIPTDDAFIDEPDTGVIEALRDSDRPEAVLRGHRMAAQKVRNLAWRMRQKAALAKKG